MGRPVSPLPVDQVLPDVLRAVQDRGTCVLVAPTGAGKTTRLPSALESGGHGPVVVLEPRRLAARAAARRVASESGAELGREVGYHVRFDNKTSRATRITFATEGVFVRRLQADPFLSEVGAVVLDEFHERSLDVDLALAMVRRVQREVRPELKLVVTSATLDAERIAEFLDGAPIVRSEGRLHPVAIEHLAPEAKDRDARGPISIDYVVRGVRHALDATGGDLLVFLPGRGEIRRVRDALSDTARARGVRLVDLYGDLEPGAQDAALMRGEGRRVVLATNVAESSVTVAGVTGVVDTGLARVLTHEPGVGMDRLRVQRISRASADQRAGRAGREEPGICVRLWSGADDRTLADHDVPEVRRADLAGSALQLLAWGETDLAAFPWLDPPRPEALSRALDLLSMLGATDGGGLTADGRAFASMPVHPRLAALLRAGAAFGVPDRAALAAAALSERDCMRRDAQAGGRVSDSDVLERVRLLEHAAEDGLRAVPALVPGAARGVLQAARQLLRIADRASRKHGQPADRDEALLRALYAAFPDRLTRRRDDDPTRGVMVGGRGVRLARESAVTEGELFLAIDIDAGKGEGLVRQASLVERDWIDGGATRTETRAVFDPERERVITVRRVMLGALALSEVEGGGADVDAEEIADALCRAAALDPRRALGCDRKEIDGVLTRLACLREWRPDLGLPAVDEAALAALLPSLAPGCRSFADLRAAPLVPVLLGGLTRAQSQALERDAPERIEIPSGSKVRLTYEPGKPPVLAARIQELFGLRETPRVAGGRVPVLLHLLAPNGRPQQVTSDLASFWSDAYFEVRKDLRRRYPKHAWPEDPLTAPPTRRAGGRRRG